MSRTAVLMHLVLALTKSVQSGSGSQHLLTVTVELLSIESKQADSMKHLYSAIICSTAGVT